MLDGLALLLAILGFVILFSTLKKFRKMIAINKHPDSVTGIISSFKILLNRLVGPAFGITYAYVINYQPKNASEPYELYIRTHNYIMSKKYNTGDRIEVIYDADAPYKAYPKLEQNEAKKDIWKTAISFGLSAIIFTLSQFFKHKYMP